MGLNTLENKIRENKAFFDEELSSGHQERFLERLNQMEAPKKITARFPFASPKAFAYAISISVLMLISIYTLIENPFKSSPAQLSEELLSVKMYYNQQTEAKMSELKNIESSSNTNSVLFESTEDRLSKLDKNTQQLEDKLSLAHGNKQLENAYILSLKAKSEVVNQVYTQIVSSNIITQ